MGTLDLTLIFVAGTLGSAHCLGMCGPLALSINRGDTAGWRTLRRQILYSAGRVCTYAVLGAFAGFGGWKLARFFPWLTNIGAVLTMVAGLWLLFQGLAAAGIWKPRGVSASGPCLVNSLFRPFLRLPGATGVFIAGLATGLLPCGLVYGFLALATASGSIWQGAALMAVFGLGTTPAMIATGCGGAILSLAARRHVFRLAAWCLVLTGALSIVRGASFVHIPQAGQPAPTCPWCSTSEVPPE